jgi:N-dimethylarginine dimethylaminohydrolase
MESRLYTPDEFRAAPADLAPRAEPREVLLCEPSHYRIEQALNPHMASGGALHRVDRREAWAQWEALGAAYARLGYPVHVLAGAPGLPDMVFAANQALPFEDERGRRAAVLARMQAPSRRGEVPHYAKWLAARGYACLEIPSDGAGEDALTLEGAGDCLFLPGRRALLAGIGPRTTAAALARLAPLLGMPVIGLRLVHERFYHLDTCLMPLSPRSALFVREALAPDAAALVERLFEDPIAVPLAEADSPGFACNAHSPDGRHVLIQRGSKATLAALAARGFEPIELETGEFVKAGGSVFCLKMMAY